MFNSGRLAWTAALAATFLALTLWMLSPKALSYLLSYEYPAQYMVRPFPATSDVHALAKLGLKPKKSVDIINPDTGARRTIHGRFLHITDFHPDPFYKPGTDIDELCHRGKGDASKYGDAIKGCDSPMILVEKTIDWIAENLKDKVDFIVWTGDNMRHDNDRQYPRTELETFQMNERISELMHEKFGVMPIPSLGNNDVYPHNLFALGPTLQTREFFKIWKPFVPQAQMHLFNRGVYFFTEVIPNKLAVLSINTLYLFGANPLVESCDKRKDFGYKLFLWMGYVLKEMRQRKMKVWLTGHVPPTARNYDISCLRKYIIWSHEYRDVIVGGLYGHMNIDHFLPLDSKQAYRSMKRKFESVGYEYEAMDTDNEENNESEDFSLLEDLYGFYNAPVVRDTIDDISQEFGFDFSFTRNIDVQAGVPQRKVRYMDSVRKSLYAAIKGLKRSGENGERYSVVHVATSVVPTFNPGMRVWEYNISDLYETDTYEGREWGQFLTEIDHFLDEEDSTEHEDLFATFKDKADTLKRDKSLSPKVPKGTALGPAYVPQLFTPERYVQYFLDLKAVNVQEKPFAYEVEYATDVDYQMQDLTVAEWLKLGRKLGSPVKEKNKKKKDENIEKGRALGKLWQQFLAHSFANSDYENLGYG